MIIRKSKYVTMEQALEIGTTGNAEQVEQAFDKIKEQKYYTKGGRSVGPDNVLHSLSEGAVKAFQNGNVENVQTFIDRQPNSFANIVFELMKEPGNHDKEMDAQAVINCVLEKVPQENKQEMLDYTLRRTYDTVSMTDGIPRFHTYPHFIAPLLEAGAKPNVTLLIHAMDYNAADEIVKLISEHGASFKETLYYMRQDNWERYRPGCIEKLRGYEERITGRSPEKTMEELEQNVSDLTTKLSDAQDEIVSLREQLNSRRQVRAPGSP